MKIKTEVTQNEIEIFFFINKSNNKENVFILGGAENHPQNQWINVTDTQISLMPNVGQGLSSLRIQREVGLSISKNH